MLSGSAKMKTWRLQGNLFNTDLIFLAPYPYYRVPTDNGKPGSMREVYFQSGKSREF